MRTPDLRRSVRQLAGPTAGYIIVGSSAFAFLASGPRLLGPDGYSDQAVAWMIVMIFASGLAVPGELTVNSAAAEGSARAAQTRVRTLLLLTSTPFLVCLALSLGGGSVMGVSEPVWWAGVCLAVFAYALSSGVRGRLGGQGGYVAYGSVLAIEGASRIVLLAIAWVFKGDTTVLVWLLALAIGGPVVLSGVVAAVWLHKTETGVDVPTAHHPASKFGPITVIAVSMQVVLGSAPLWLNSQPGVDPATAGLFVSVASYMRVPLLVTSGTTIVVLSRSSSAVASRDTVALKSTLTHHLALVGGAAAGLSMVLIAVSPIGLRLLYGPAIGGEVGGAVLVTMALATVLIAVGTVANQTLVACHRAREAAGVWVAAAVITTLGLSLGATSLLGASVAVLAGVTFGAVVAIAAAPWVMREVHREHVAP